MSLVYLCTRNATYEQTALQTHNATVLRSFSINTYQLTDQPSSHRIPDQKGVSQQWKPTCSVPCLQNLSICVVLHYSTPLPSRNSPMEQHTHTHQCHIYSDGRWPVFRLSKLQTEKLSWIEVWSTHLCFLNILSSYQFSTATVTISGRHILQTSWPGTFPH